MKQKKLLNSIGIILVLTFCGVYRIVGQISCSIISTILLFGTAVVIDQLIETD